MQIDKNTIGEGVNSLANIRGDLRNALKNKEFFLCYQPLIDIKTMKTCCFEALIRWKHHEREIISPLKFIPLAEQNKLIIPIGKWVLKSACKQMKIWHEEGYYDCSLSVNVSIVQLSQPDFSDVVNNILSETGLSPEYLEIEITETAFMDSLPVVENNLNRLSRQGIKISMDDFGIGYNSLKKLKQLSVNSLKIDSVFIRNIKDYVSNAIIDSIILTGNKIGAQIIAEGVETEEQYKYMKKKGCHKIQGYYFSKPLLPEEVPKFLKKEFKK